MIISVVACEPLEGVEWQGASAVVVDSLEGCNREQECGLADRLAGQPLSDDGTA